MPLFTFALLTSVLGCGGSDGGNSGSTADDGGGAEGGADDGGSSGGGAGTATGGTVGSGAAAGDGGTMATGGSPEGGADTGGGGSTATGGSTSTGGTGGGGGVTGARSCQRDCMDLASTACAGADFTQEKCVMDCEQAWQDAVAEARSIGCLDEFLALDACRADDPVCTHPNPRACVPENDAYLQCLENSI